MKKIDYLIIFVCIVGVLVLALVLGGKNNKLSATPVESTQKIQFTVAIKGATISQDTELLKQDENVFLTIRNVPYKELKVVSFQKSKKQVVIAAQNPNGYLVVDDVASPNQYDYLIKLEDEAKITSDGAVVGGNKIKIGVPVVLENFNFRFGGTVSSIEF